MGSFSARQVESLVPDPSAALRAICWYGNCAHSGEPVAEKPIGLVFRDAISLDGRMSIHGFATSPVKDVYDTGTK